MWLSRADRVWLRVQPVHDLGVTAQGVCPGDEGAREVLGAVLGGVRVDDGDGVLDQDRGGRDDDVERMEVVLGPGSALYGPNTANGVLHILTRSPLSAPSTTFSIMGGERDLLHGMFRVSQPFGDNFGVKLSGQYLQADDLNDRSELTEPWRFTPYVSIVGLILVFQISAIYFFNVVHKTGPAWKNGTAVKFVLYVDRMVTPIVADLRAANRRLHRLREALRLRPHPVRRVAAQQFPLRP